MALNDVTEPAAVAEFDALGRDQFLDMAGFGRAKSYFLDFAVTEKVEALYG